MRHAILKSSVAALSLLVGSCDLGGTEFTSLPFETRFAFVNLSREFYATLGIRDSAKPDLPIKMSPLLPPGATYREDFLRLVGTGCPDSVDLRLLLYRRVNNTVPVGLDDREEVEQTPTVADEIMGVPACAVEALIAYTIVNWDAPEGSARVKVAQGSGRLESAISNSGIFPVNDDGAWVVEGVAGSLSTIKPPSLLPKKPISGRVTFADGFGVPAVGVLIRTFFRVRFDDDDDTNDPDAGFGDPIAFAITDESGAFSLDRPPGAYQLEFFSDDFRFRPARVVIESPIQIVQIIAEPL